MYCLQPPDRLPDFASDVNTAVVTHTQYKVIYIFKIGLLTTDVDDPRLQL